MEQEVDGKGKLGYEMRISKHLVEHQVYISDLDDTMVTVQAQFDEQISKDLEEIDNHLAT